MADKRSTFRVGVVVFVVGAAVAAYMMRPAADTNPGHSGEGTVVETTALPRLLDLGADKCVPCKMMAPILEELKEDYVGTLAVEFIDVWKDPAAARPYGIKVIPTQIFFSPDGTELFRHEGFFSREDILAKWRELDVALPDKGA